MKARAAALEEKQKLEKKRMTMESKMQELKWKEEMHQIETERKNHEAKEEVLEMMEQKVDSSMMPTRQEGTEKVKMPGIGGQVTTEAQPTDCHEAGKDVTEPVVPSTDAPVPAHCQDPEPTHTLATAAPTQVTATALADILSIQAQRSQLPPTEPGVFKGDHTTFCIWLNAFETCIETRCSSHRERLHYLGHYTAWEARSAITGFLQMGTDDALTCMRRSA